MKIISNAFERKTSEVRIVIEWFQTRRVTLLIDLVLCGIYLERR